MRTIELSPFEVLASMRNGETYEAAKRRCDVEMLKVCEKKVAELRLRLGMPE